MAEDLKRGPGYSLCSCPAGAITEELTLGQDSVGWPWQLQLSVLRDGVQPPMLWDPVPEAPQPCFRYFSPYPPCNLENRWGVQPLSRHHGRPIVLSLFLTVRGIPRCQDQKLQPACFCSSHASEAGTSAEPGLPHSGTLRVLRTRLATAPMVPRAQSMRGSPAPANLPRRGGAFPGGPRRFPSWYWPGKPSARF